MIYSYYPGCTFHHSGKEYDMSFKAVCSMLDIDLREVKNWICCGASSAHVDSKLLFASLSIKNLAEVEKEGLSEIVVPCIGCYSSFKRSVYEIERDSKLKNNVDEVIDYQFQNKVKILNPLEIFNNSIKEKIRNKIKKDLSKLKIVCYYGCVLTRPPEVMKYDICEYPVSMDMILKDIGVKTLDWSYKTECCGVSLNFTNPEIVLRLANNIFENARDVGADAIAVACPLCHINLDSRQGEVNKVYNKDYNLPILYFTQVLGLGLGCSVKQLGLGTHFVKTDKLLKKIEDREFSDVR
ncbi:MAG: CoB--CoM heterodisulfide reductase iron-sulfur subunit B family protein [Candidatus Humimicrobiaceae bacterium]